MQWNVVCPGEGATSMVQTSDGGYVLAVTYPDAFGLVKLDYAGDLSWNQTYAGRGDEAGVQSLIQTSDGGFAFEAGRSITRQESTRVGS